ncbi:cyclin-like f-box [Fusarium subglutinans]|uniref:Cyclin-like f-box n=1 Tax=Gibberella subglutinans TaxID=42677 RepID=A0A8H5PUC1_GIBSU|nr:cyclin-like f-box [Fusarium subglutinans]KAF5602408.1 cyclin-like f-box [Fusarium subglutinans]
MNAATYFPPRPMTALELNDRIIQTIGYSRFNEQYLPGAIHGPIPHPPAILDQPAPYFVPDNRPHPSIIFGNYPRPEWPVGALRRLIWWLDLQTLFNLRQTSRGMREFISQSEVYKAIIEALHLYKAILGTKYAQSVLVVDFYDLLTTMRCGICGEYAMLISIPEWLRLCQRCVETGQRRGFGLDPITRVSRFVTWNIFAQSLAPDAAARMRDWDRDFFVGLKG